MILPQNISQFSVGRGRNATVVWGSSKYALRCVALRCVALRCVVPLSTRFHLAVTKVNLSVLDNEKFAWNSSGSQWSVHHV